MAIVLDNTQCTELNNTGETFAFNVGGTGSNRLLIAYLGFVFGTAPSAVPTYAGTNMTLLASNTTSHNKIYIWYLVAPTVGNNNIVFSGGGCQACAKAVQSWTGVDQADPFRNNQIINQGVSPVSWNTDYVTQPNDEVSSFVFAVRRDNCGVADVGPSGRNTRDCAVNWTNQTGLNDGSGALFHGTNLASGLTYNMDYVIGSNDGTHEAGVVIKPKPSLRGRSVKYFFPFWDADPQVFDDQGKVVEPSDLKPDNWIEAMGLALPSSENPVSFVQDPQRSKIIEINTDQDTATLKTSKNQFAEILISRVAAGS